MGSLLEFKRRYVKAIQNGNAAIFAGAGLSRSSGFVDWKDLLRDLAEAVQLDVDKEADLVEVAQYYCNEKGRRFEINDRILNSFVTDSQKNINIHLLARMPIHTYWTTNYDSTLETILKQHQKRVDVKITPESLATSLSGSDVTVYKMHGDYTNPAECVITKDDYEMYNEKRQLFTTALQGDLVSKTFLFIGFSFEDPNLKYILSRIRVLLNENARTHYCFFKRLDRNDYSNDEDYYYDLNKQSLRIHDLERYGIEAILLNSYDEITSILKDIFAGYKSNSIFISGSAQEYGETWNKTAPNFIKELVRELYYLDYRIITGHARGIGSYIISSVIEECQSDVTKLEKRLIIKAFPYEDKDRDDYELIKTEYRQGIFEYAGIAIFMFGNKLIDGEITLADGVYEEYKIAKQANAFIIPIGSTGYTAKKIWDDVYENIDSYPYLSSEIMTLQNSTNPQRIIQSIKNILLHIQNTL